MCGYVEHAQPDFSCTLRADDLVYILEPLTASARQWCEEVCGVDASEPEFRLNLFEHAIARYLRAIDAAGLRVEHVRTPMQ